MSKSRQRQRKYRQHVLLVLLAISIAVMSACGSPDSAEAASHGSTTQGIIGGTPAAIADFPWQVSLWSSGGASFKCGGVIVDEQWVLTAQHCVEGAIGGVPGVPPTVIVAGVSRLSQSSAGQSRDVVDFIHYPGYVGTGRVNRDLTLLKLKSPLDLSAAGARAVPLVTTADAASGLIAAGTKVIATGWGSTIVGPNTAFPDELQQVNLGVNIIFGGEIRLFEIGKSACLGDSGGPLVVRDGSGTWKLAGITSAGDPGDCSRDSLYVDLSTSEHQMWISRSIGKPGGGTVRNDLNKDGRTDLVWHQGSSGETAVWFMNGTVMASQAPLDSRYLVPDSSGWRFAGMGDFNYDGKVDVLWHNGGTGVTQVWYMDGVTMSSQAQVDPRHLVPDSSGWRFAGMGDFNYDGKVDILWRNGSTGVTQVWYMDGVTMSSQAQIDPRHLVPDTSGWRFAGTGDFNYDGRVDILWHNGGTGATQVWYMDGVTMSSQAQIDPRYLVPDSSGWRFAGTGDFNSDGRDDILWHNGATGVTQVWFMNGPLMADQAQIDPRYLVPDSSGWGVAGY